MKVLLNSNHDPDPQPTLWAYEDTHDRADGVIVAGLVGLADLQSLSRRYRRLLWIAPGKEAGDTLTSGLPGLITLAWEGTWKPVHQETIETFVQANASSLPDLKLAQSVVETDEPDFSPFVESIRVLLDETFRVRRSREVEGTLRQCRFFENIGTYLQNRVPSTWEGWLRGATACIVGAGPSLETVLPHLETWRDRLVLFVADSAVSALNQRGLNPDFTISIDLEKYPGPCLTPGSNPGWVITGSLSPAEWWQTVGTLRCRTLSGNCLPEDFLEGLGVPKTGLIGSVNSGIVAFELARWMGAGTFILAGMDHALDPKGGKRHTASADPSFQRGGENKPIENHPTVPGNYTERVPTFSLYEWAYLQRCIAALPSSTRVFNLNDRGARFVGCELVHPEKTSILDSVLAAGAATPDIHTIPGAPDTLSEAQMGSILEVLGRLSDGIGEAALKAAQAFDPYQAAQVKRPLIGLFQDDCSAKLLGWLAFKLIPHLVASNDPGEPYWRQAVIDLASAELVLRQQLEKLKS